MRNTCAHTHNQIIFHTQNIPHLAEKGKYGIVLSLSRTLKDNRWTNTMNVARKRLQCKYVQSSRLILAPPSFSFSLSLLLLHLLEIRESLRTKLPKKRERKRKEQANKYRSAVSFKYADLQIDEQEERERKNTHTYQEKSKTNKKTNVCSHFEDNITMHRHRIVSFNRTDHHHHIKRKRKDIEG